ncbi:MAG TPA: peptidoglycan DD-metalloendopeptidase family protein [Salinarimonas sp.]|nr:peptidoglycan DD-metalloendopeptidase family protein [Salinarimonas sp.]
MRVRLGLECRSALPRLAMVGLVSGLAAACSTDTARFSQNPFSNPFSVGQAEPTATGSLPDRAKAAPAPVTAVPTAPVMSQPLAPPAPSVAYNRPPAAPSAPAPAPAAPRAVASNGPAGWTVHGGSAVVVGQGDSLQALATRYGVPAQAILQANGLSTASQVAPGRTVVIPVFNAVGAPAVASAPVPRAPAPVAAAPKPQMRLVEGPKPAPSPAKPEPKRAEPAKPAPVAAKPSPAPAKPAPVAAKAPPAKPEPVKPAPARVAAQPERKPEPAKPAPVAKAVPAKPEPAKPEPKVAEVQKAPPKAAEAPKPAQQPQPQKVASLGTPPIAAPAAPAPAPAPQPARPEPVQTASLPTSPASGLDFRWPARGRVISGFGSSGNEGINIAVPEGTPVRAAEGGTVAYAGSELKGYGNLVLIRHDNGYVSAYAHNGEISVKRGDKVGRGQVIAKSGQSGNVNSPQLHFEIRKGSTPVDPMPYLSN